MDLGNYRISTKVLGIVCLLSAVTIAVAGAGITALSSMHTASSEIDVAGAEALTGANLVANSIRLNRVEFRIAANPSAEEIEAGQKEIADFRAAFEAGLEKAMQTAGENQRRLLAVVEPAYRAYLLEIDDTLTVARRNGAMASDVLAASDDLSRQAERLREEVDSFIAKVQAA
ncbi:MAG: MCP four helix bundle domain-containing protein [Inquilinaceae bacterium]